MPGRPIAQASFGPLGSSSCGFPSDTNMLVDACIARVREAARLDDDAVLPPLPVVAPRRDVVILTKNTTAGSAAGSGLASSTPGVTAGDALDGSRVAVTQRVSRRSGGASRGSRWAVVLCAFVASGFAGAAFVESPAGREPKVVRVTSAARAHATHAAQATAALFSR